MEKAKAESVVVKDSKFGKGIFTTVNLPSKSVLFKITGKPLTFEQTLALGDNECYSLQVSKNKYIIPDPPFIFSNHSCSPNCGITRNMEFITLRDISRDEELYWDYSTSMLEKHWTMECGCEHYNCRKTICDFDLIPFHIQETYLHMKIVLPFIAEEFYFLSTIYEKKALPTYTRW
jgi:hypothetical protein